MPVSRGRKLKTKTAPPKKRHRQTEKRSEWPGKIFAGFLALCTVVGFGIAALTLLPRVVVEGGEPFDLADAYSTPFTISNNNYIPLERVGVALGLCQLKLLPNLILQGPNFSDCSSSSGARLALTQWQNHRLGIDEKWRLLLHDAIKGPATLFSGGDISFVVSFTPWPWSLIADWPFRREKEFRFKAIPAGNGNWRWFPQTIDRP